jgi:hypothetical protein
MRRLFRYSQPPSTTVFIEPELEPSQVSRMALLRDVERDAKVLS